MPPMEREQSARHLARGAESFSGILASRAACTACPPLATVDPQSPSPTLPGQLQSMAIQFSKASTTPFKNRSKQLFEFGPVIISPHLLSQSSSVAAAATTAAAADPMLRSAVFPNADSLPGLENSAVAVFFGTGTGDLTSKTERLSGQPYACRKQNWLWNLLRCLLACRNRLPSLMHTSMMSSFFARRGGREVLFSPALQKPVMPWPRHALRELNKTAAVS